MLRISREAFLGLVLERRFCDSSSSKTVVKGSNQTALFEVSSTFLFPFDGHDLGFLDSPSGLLVSKMDPDVHEGQFWS